MQLYERVDAIKGFRERYERGYDTHDRRERARRGGGFEAQIVAGLLLVGGRDHDGNTSVRARDEREATPRTLRHVSNYYTTPVRNR
ncbi:hypothetical protein DOS48_09600 [Halorubrum sp. PV6]|nr:hypothetical protein DOS48_09600 [Halorubrum sp. PV6]